MVTAVLTALAQLLVFVAVPFLVHLVVHRRAAGFFRWVGLHRPEGRTVALALLLVLLTAPLVLLGLAHPDVRPLVLAPTSIAGQLRLLGPSATTVGLLLVYAFVQTALAEEILFRGFIARRLIHRLGFAWGNALQALLFGALHLALFAAVLSGGAPLALAAALSVPPMLLGWTLGYLMVRRGNGSIVPGWLAHALANAIAYGVIVFLW